MEHQTKNTPHNSPVDKLITKKRRWPKIVLAVVAVIIAGVLISLNAFTNSGRPKTAGELNIKGLREKVTVTRDSDGVPHIVAENKHDLYMAQGFVEAQDRMFQMDLSRRQASGTLSEVFGAKAIDTDKNFRMFGLRRAAKKSMAAYPKESMDHLKAFSDGVNAYLDDAQGNGLPPEFKLVGYTPAKWEPLDSLTIGKYMAYDLAGHWGAQAFRQYLLNNFSTDEAKELFPKWQVDAPTILSKTATATVAIDSELLATAKMRPEEFNGSNDWVVAGSKTASGNPLLADDPHLSVAAPSLWYQVGLKAEGVDVSGVIFAGVPGIILGQNQQIAWGVTNTGPDVQDLYVEKRNPDNKHQYLYKGEWEDASVYSEDIKVKDGKTVKFSVDETRHGPVISDLGKSAAAKDTVYAMRWTALDPTTELEAVFRINEAKNWDEFERGLEYFKAPAQNFVFASKDGTIAYKANGNIPIRKGDGFLPVPGWTGEYEWTGFIPYDKLPRTVNPKEGFVATANNKVVDDNYPYHISWNWAQPYRAERITEMLKASDKLTAADMSKIQDDYKDLHAAQIAPIFISELKKNKNLTADQNQAISILEKWDYRAAKEQAAPLIFNMWYEKVQKNLFEKKISKEAMELFEGKGLTTDNLFIDLSAGKKSMWINQAGGAPKLLESSLTQTIKDLKEAQGKDLNAWEWGKFHQVEFKNPLAQSVSALKPLFEPWGRVADNGSRTTVRAAGWEDDGTTDLASSWRFVADLTDLSTTEQIVAPGISGHPRSKFYGNHVDEWLTGKHYKTKIEGYSGDVLTLTP